MMITLTITPGVILALAVVVLFACGLGMFVLMSQLWMSTQITYATGDVRYAKDEAKSQEPILNIIGIIILVAIVVIITIFVTGAL
jgi:archaellum biogenesis protein FlaJ (TadC family)